MATGVTEVFRLPAVRSAAEAERMDRDPLLDAQDLVAELFPQTRWAL
jgi:hypothetical protein